VSGEPKCPREKDALAEAFSAFWNGLATADQETFEAEAVRRAALTHRDGYARWKPGGGKLFEIYRQAILRDHFQAMQKKLLR
jgi:hypothetical protein